MIQTVRVMQLLIWLWIDEREAQKVWDGPLDIVARG